MGLSLLFILFLGLLITAGAQDEEHDGMSKAFRPSVAIVIGVLSIMFSLTFLLLMYAKFCQSTPTNLFLLDPELNRHPHGLGRSCSRFSGIDKTVIESLPFFRFSSLRGSKEGLECAVCLSKFDDAEILRLLPKCKHAFHIDCVDQWLKNHSSCPLCRYKVNVEDLTIINCSNSLRHSREPSDLGDDPALELFVHREPVEGASSSLFTLGSSFRKLADKPKKDELLITSDNQDNGQSLHKFKHRIIVSDVLFKSRWSDAASTDLMFLNSEMLNTICSKRFSSSQPNNGQVAMHIKESESEDDGISKIREEMEKKRAFETKISRINRSNISVSDDIEVGLASAPYVSADMNPSSKIHHSNPRSMSEIVNISRFAEFGSRRYRMRDVSMKEEKVRRLWLPIVRRTVQWLAGRERRSESRLDQQVSDV